MDGVNARLMIANRKAGCAKDKTMPVIFCSFCLADVGPELIGNRSARKAVVNKQLNFDASVRPRLINHPTGDKHFVSVIEYAAKIQVGGRKEKSDRDGGDQKRFNN